MEPEKKKIEDAKLTLEQEAEAIAAILSALDVPKEVIEECRKHLQEQGPGIEFHWDRDRDG